MTTQSDTSNKLDIYHLHSCQSRQGWVKGMTKPFPCDCGLLRLIEAEKADELQKHLHPQAIWYEDLGSIRNTKTVANRIAELKQEGTTNGN